MTKKKVKAPLNESLHAMRSSPNPASVNCEQADGEELERPMGRKTAKKRKRMDGELHSESSNAFFCEMREHISTSSIKRREEYEVMVKLEEEHLELKRKQVLINETKEKREQQMYEASIMATETTNMESQMASFYNSLKAEILRNRL